MIISSLKDMLSIAFPPSTILVLFFLFLMSNEEQFKAITRKIQISCKEISSLLQSLKHNLTEQDKDNRKNSSNFVQPCKDVISAVCSALSPIVEIDENRKISRKNLSQKDFEKYFLLLVNDSLSFINENVPSKIEFSAAFIPIFNFLISSNAREISSKQLNDSYQDAIGVFSNFIEKYKLSDFSEIIQKITDFSKKIDCTKDAKTHELLNELIEKISSTSSIEKHLKEAKVLISSLKAELLTVFCGSDQDQEVKKAAVALQDILTNAKAIINENNLLENIKKSLRILKNENCEVFEIEYEEIEKCRAFITKCFRLIIGTAEFSRFAPDFDVFVHSDEEKQLSILEKIAEEGKLQMGGKSLSFAIKEDDGALQKTSAAFIAMNLADEFSSLKPKNQKFDFIISMFRALHQVTFYGSFDEEVTNFLNVYEALLATVIEVGKTNNETMEVAISALSQEIPQISLDFLLDLTPLQEVISQLAGIKEIVVDGEKSVTYESIADSVDAKTKIKSLSQNAFSIIQKMQDLLNFIEISKKIKEVLMLKDKKEEEFDIKRVSLKALGLAPSINSLFSSRVFVSSEFIAKWIHVLGASLSGTIKKEDFVDLAENVPFIDFSRKLGDAVVKSNAMLLMVNKEINDESIKNASEELRTVFFNSFIDCRIDLKAFEQKGNALMHMIFKHSSKLFKNVHKLWITVDSFASFISIIAALKDNLNELTENNYSLRNLFMANMLTCMRSSADILSRSNLVPKQHHEVFDSFKEFSFEDEKMFFQMDRKRIGEFLDLTYKSTPLIDSDTLYTEVSSFIQLFALYSASQLRNQSSEAFGFLEIVNQIFVQCKEDLKRMSTASICYFSVLFHLSNAPSDCSNKDIVEKIQSITTIVDSASAYAVQNFLLSIIEILLNEEDPVEPESSELIVQYSTIEEILDEIESVVKLNKEIKQSQVTNGEIIKASQELTSSVKENLSKFLSSSGSDEEKHEIESIIADSNAMSTKLAEKINEYKELVGDGIEIPSIEPERITALYKLQLQSSIASIESNDLKHSIAALKNEMKEIEKMSHENESKKEANPQSDVIQKILNEITKPKIDMPDDRDKLAKMYEDIAMENESLLDELTKLQGDNVSHEEQLDMLLIKSDESRVLKSFNSSKEEIDAIKRQIKATNQSINAFSRTKERYESEGYDATTGFRSFIKRSRENLISETKMNVASQRKFVETTMKSAKRKLDERDDIARRVAELNQAKSNK